MHTCLTALTSLRCYVGRSVDTPDKSSHWQTTVESFNAFVIAELISDYDQMSVSAIGLKSPPVE